MQSATPYQNDQEIQMYLSVVAAACDCQNAERMLPLSLSPKIIRMKVPLSQPFLMKNKQMSIRRTQTN